ncbi:MAG: hypothetical protein GYA12_05590 [Chloroflexi bacterium]|jgi:Asp-tRNA(Asn)/Glu-tRNA(Gln) amidotransferase C subunit|nr:hypothetical protein [Chloroflexota bacterium]
MERILALVGDVDQIPVDDIRPILGGFIGKVTACREDKVVKGQIQFWEAPRVELVNNEFL